MSNYTKIILYFTFQLAFIANVCALQTDTIQKRSYHFEVSFGQSLLFIDNSDVINIHNQSNIVIPTSSVLFFCELRTNKEIRVPVFFNLPTAPKEFLVNGQLINEKSSSSLGSISVKVRLKLIDNFCHIASFMSFFV